MFKLTTRFIAVIVIVAVGASGAYAGYFHDQSIKGVYSSFQPQITTLNSDISTRDSQIASLSSQIADLRGEIAALNSQISQLHGQNAELNAQVTSLQARVDNLQAQLNSLQAPSMDGVFSFTGGSCFFGCSATVRGAWVNYGTQNARNVVVTLKWSKAGSFVQQNTINVGVVAGKSVALYPDTSYTLSSAADHLDWSFTFTA